MLDRQDLLVGEAHLASLDAKAHSSWCRRHGAFSFQVPSSTCGAVFTSRLLILEGISLAGKRHLDFG